MAFKLRSPLHNDENNKTKPKSIEYYGMSSNVLSFDQNNRLKKIWKDPNQKGKVFKQNGDYYPSDRFTPNKDNTGVTLKGGYEYDETGKLVAQKAVSNPKGNLVSKRDEGKTNPFAGTSNSGEAGVSGYRTGPTASNPEGKKLGEDVPMGKNPFIKSGGESKPSSFLSGFGIFPSRTTPVAGPTSISQSKDSKISPNKKGNYLKNSFDANTSTTGNPSSSTSRKNNMKKNQSTSKGVTNASSLIPTGGFGTGGKLNTSSRPDFAKTNKMLDNAGSNTKNTKKQVEPTNTIDAGSNTNKDKSGGYLKDTKNFSLGVDTKLSTGSMPKFERTVTNARSADYDMIRAKGRGKIDRLKTRLDKREGRVANRVEASSMRIKSRQQRSGNRYASKMEARTNTGTNPGKFESQKKLDAFEKVMDSPKATPRTLGAGNISSGSKAPSLRTPKSNQTVAKPSMKLNTSKQASITIDDSKIKKGAKQAKGGGRVSKDTYQNLTGFKKLENKKPGSSKGMRRGVSNANTSIKVPGLSRGPQA